MSLDLQELERRADAHLAEHEGRVESDVVAQSGEDDEGPVEEAGPPVLRPAIATALTVVAAGVMVGGVFTGVAARVYAIVAAILGVALGAVLSRSRKPLATNLAIVVGLFGIGLLMILPSGAGNVLQAARLAATAANEGNALRPPVPLSPGWQAIIGWLVGTVGFVASWVAFAMNRQSLAVLLPLPVAAVAGISVAKEQQVASGIAVLVLFAIALGVLSSASTVGAGDEKPPLSYELRKAVRAVPLIAVIVGALVLLSQSDLLFPKPYIDPTQEPQKPKTVPLSNVEDRVLFEVESKVSGPWRVGALDVYDGRDWRLPPLAQSELASIPEGGILDETLTPGATATFTVAGMAGTVLPSLPNTIGIVAEGPELAYDTRSNVIRVANGIVRTGMTYAVTAPSTPAVEDLEAVTFEVPEEMQRFTEMPGPPPPAVAALIERAPKTSKWAEFDFLRTYILDNVVASGVGAPKSIGPERLEDMLAGSKQGSPFEIVAAQAMLARWVGVPARLGYGFDGGELVGDVLQVRPKHGATFPEVWFPGFKWLPVIGVPKQAEPSVGNTEEQQFDPSVLPSDDIAVNVVVPTDTPPRRNLLEELRAVALVVVALGLLVLIAYIVIPIARKAWRRSRRRSAARAAGNRVRLALAYSEFRDTATDFGFGYPSDTPLEFVTRFPDDDEHLEFAWLVTRALWGDLQDAITDGVANDAEELSKALQRRLAGAQPPAMRAVAAASRLSLRRGYAPELDRFTVRKERERVSSA